MTLGKDNGNRLSAAKGAFCPRCAKPERLCVCRHITPIEVKIRILVLQHPKEQREVLGTVPLLAASIDKTVVKVGLSWPNLERALGSPCNPKKWGVLFLGTKKSGGSRAKNIDLNELEGLVALDGNWRQAKAIWWRNPWLLKLKRIVLSPKARSLYGKARREPRPESLSTLEAVALVLSEASNDRELFEKLTCPLKKLVEQVKEP